MEVPCERHHCEKAGTSTEAMGASGGKLDKTWLHIYIYTYVNLYLYLYIY